MQIDEARPLSASRTPDEAHPTAQDTGLRGRVGEQLAAGTVERPARSTPDNHGLLGPHQRVHLVRGTADEIGHTR